MGEDFCRWLLIGRHIPIPKLVRHHQTGFRPHHRHRLVPSAPIILTTRRFLVTLDNRGNLVNGRDPLLLSMLDYYIKKSIILRRFSDCEFAQFVTRVRPLEPSIILDNLRRNCRSARASRLLASNFSATEPARISPFGDEVARFSAARQSAHLGTNAFTSPRSFGCGCAALSVLLSTAQPQPNVHVATIVLVARIPLCPAALKPRWHWRSWKLASMSSGSPSERKTREIASAPARGLPASSKGRGPRRKAS